MADSDDQTIQDPTVTPEQAEAFRAAVEQLPPDAVVTLPAGVEPKLVAVGRPAAS